MKIRKLHSWDVTPREARGIQEALRDKVMGSGGDTAIRTVVGTDVSFPSKSESLAAVVAVSYPELEVLETVVRRRPCTFPYVPGLLAFRETPVLADALSELKTDADVILCDGQGLAHPRGMGLACHVGLIADKPTIGCAKSRLFGTFDPPGPEKGSMSRLVGKKGETIGFVLRTRKDVSPVYVSVGHRMELGSAVEIILNCSPRYRIPEPLRMAHKLAGGQPVCAGGAAPRPPS